MSAFSASAAVMARRAPDLVEQDDAQRALWRKLDYFPTPPWAARAGALLIHELDPGAVSAWEPACGEGHMAAALADAGVFSDVRASDIQPFGYGEVHDFLSPGLLPASAAGARPDWVVTNPPFRHAGAFVERGLQVALRGVAVLCRLAFMESTGRHALLFGDRPVSVVAPFMERVPMKLGAWDPGVSSATAYAWFVWTKAPSPLSHPELRPIPPGTRARLTRPDDARRWGAAYAAPLFEQVAGEDGDA